MATPTPSHPHHPNSASKKPTGHASTPSHLGFSSPAPRSVPSPAATRKDHAGKTPINHPTTSSQGSKTIGSTPMVHNLSQTGNTVSSSPGANMMGFGTPIGLGVEGITPNGINMPTPGMAGVSMSMTMSDLGLTASGGQKRNEDEERRLKMRKVLQRVGRPKGRVSEEGIARASRRVGFANDIDAVKLTPEERERVVGNRAIGTAGSKILIEVDLKDHVPQNIQVGFDTENEKLLVQGELVAKVLLGDLQVVDSTALHAKLDNFAANLERLARVDRLCPNQVNCFEALSGIYTSLLRLYEQEKTAAKELDVMRKKSGRPTVHAHGKLGMAVEYWQESAQASAGKQTDGDMDIDQQNGSGGEAQEGEAQEGEDGIYRLSIGIESYLASVYPSVRLSDTWLPDPLALPASDSGDGLPWQEPPPTFASLGIESSAMNIDGTSNLPDLRFTVKFEPPIILPWQVASSVVQSVGLPAPSIFIMQAWHSLLLDPTSTAQFDARKDASNLTSERSVFSMRHGEEIDVTHHCTLSVVKPDTAYKLEELPFSHPRQLVEMLPTLRQWACFGSLIRSTFAGASTTTKQQDVAFIGNVPITHDAPNTSASLSLADLLTPPATPSPATNKLPVDVALITSPVPSLSLTFPSTSAEATVGNIVVRVLPNAELTVTTWEGLAAGAGGPAMGDAEDLEGKKMARALQVCGDLGIWVEWLRNRVR